MRPNPSSDVIEDSDCGMHRPDLGHMKSVKDETGELTGEDVDDERFDHRYQ